MLVFKFKIGGKSTVCIKVTEKREMNPLRKKLTPNAAKQSAFAVLPQHTQLRMEGTNCLLTDVKLSLIKDSSLCLFHFIFCYEPELS